VTPDEIIDFGSGATTWTFQSIHDHPVFRSALRCQSALAQAEEREKLGAAAQLGNSSIPKS
jgi:hypothetical protein